jgi:hypothetical protein
MPTSLNTNVMYKTQSLPDSLPVPNQWEGGDAPLRYLIHGAPGIDQQLISWALDTLKKSGQPTKVKTGPIAF